jgi:GH18 family chitinase
MVPLVVATMLAALAPRPLVVAYVPNWIEDFAAYTATIDYSKVTHLNIAFENPVDDDGNLSFNDSDTALIDQAHAKGVKVLVSLGGGGASANPDAMKRYFLLISPSRRPAFVQKLADYVRAHNLDGIDIDLEGPSINGDYGAFVNALGKVLKTNGKLLTAALSKGYGGENIPKSSFAAFDFVNVMAYDATGPWAPNHPGQHSSFEFAKESVDYWLGRGLPKAKTVLGLPFYGYGFTEGGKSEEWPYSRIVTTYPGSESLDQTGNTIWYNGIPTIKAKSKYVLDQGLAGVMIWALNHDAPGDKSLLNAIDAVFRLP